MSINIIFELLWLYVIVSYILKQFSANVEQLFPEIIIFTQNFVDYFWLRLYQKFQYS